MRPGRGEGEKGMARSIWRFIRGEQKQGGADGSDCTHDLG
jgi:hypothetical protein